MPPESLKLCSEGFTVVEVIGRCFVKAIVVDGSDVAGLTATSNRVVEGHFQRGTKLMRLVERAGRYGA